MKARKNKSNFRYSDTLYNIARSARSYNKKYFINMSNEYESGYTLCGKKEVELGKMTKKQAEFYLAKRIISETNFI